MIKILIDKDTESTKDCSLKKENKSTIIDKNELNYYFNSNSFLKYKNPIHKNDRIIKYNYFEYKKMQFIIKTYIALSIFITMDVFVKL